MSHPRKGTGPKINLRRRLTDKQRDRYLKFSLLALLAVILGNLLVNLAIRAPLNASHPVDAILVLGGSVRREIYATQLAQQQPHPPILISQGSKDPCIWLLFQQQPASLDGVWLEKCAQSTFGNFYFSTPILRRWGAHRVKVITSQTHLPRAEWLAKIHLGARGLAVQMDTVSEKGVPGNQESIWKTGLDVTRSLLWALVSPIFEPPCAHITELAAVDLPAWEEEGFSCERNPLLEVPRFPLKSESNPLFSEFRLPNSEFSVNLAGDGV